MIPNSDSFGTFKSVSFEAADLDVEVAVIGGGPAGAATAMTLARAGVRVALVDRAMRLVSKVGEAVPPRVGVVLKSMGVWERFLDGGHLRCYGNRSAWGSSRLKEYDFIFDPYGCGWHLDRARFDAMLVRAAVDAGAIQLGGTRLVGWDLLPEGWRLDVRGQGWWSTIRARFVVDASGRAAVFARAQGTRRHRYDRLVGLVVRVAVSDNADSDTFTLVETVTDGWWYSAQLPDRKLIAVFMTDADLISRRGISTAVGWHTLLGAAQHTRARVKGCVVEGRPACIAAASAALDRAAGGSWLAVGDAAGSYDPLSSQGIVTALEDGQRAGHAVWDWLRGHPGAVAAYADLIEAQYRNYLVQRCAYYRTEQRWPSSLFWQRRFDTTLSESRTAFPRRRNYDPKKRRK